MASIEIRYRFVLPGGDVHGFHVGLDPVTLDLLTSTDDACPDWALLERHRCTNCPLHPEPTRTCPAAAALAGTLEFCGEIASHDQVRVEVETAERTLSANTTIQRGVSSLMGLVMATSGCPPMAAFKPMARFHLPFASEEETIFRSAGSYLLRQYFVAMDGGTPDLALRGLGELYADVQMVNRSMAERLRDGAREDAAVNALVLLDLFAKALPSSIEESLEEIRYLFGRRTPTDRPL